MIFGGFEKFTLIDYPGKVACMAYTIGCNFRCPYCHNPELVDETVEKRVTEEEILSFLDTRKKMLDGIVFSGGEPTMHNDLLDFIRKVKNKGFLVKLDTNGTRPDMIERAMREKLLDYIAMDIKSPMSKYSQTVARPVNVIAIRKSISLLMESSIDHEFRMTVVKALTSPEDIDEIGQEIKGAKKFYLQKFVSTKILNPQFRKKTTYSDEEFKMFQTNMNNYVKYCGIR